MIILKAQNVHRTVVLDEADMASSWVSDIIDWKEMSVGSIQAKWTGNDASDGTLIVEASNVPEEAWFDEIDTCAGGDLVLDDDGTKGKRKTRLFNLGVIGYRYSRVKYSPGSNTTGTMTVLALGKKNG